MYRSVVSVIAGAIVALSVQLSVPGDAEAGVLVKRVRSSMRTSGSAGRGWTAQPSTAVAQRTAPSLRLKGDTEKSLFKIQQQRLKYQRQRERWEQKRLAKLRREQERQLKEQAKLQKEYQKQYAKKLKEHDQHVARNPSHAEEAAKGGEAAKSGDVVLDRKKEGGDRAQLGRDASAERATSLDRSRRRPPSNESFFQKLWRRMFGS